MKGTESSGGMTESRLESADFAASTMGPKDFERVLRASQAISSEIVLPKLIETLMRIVVEHAEAERGLLILVRGEEARIEADAVTSHGVVKVTLGQRVITPLELPTRALEDAMRTRQRVVLDNATAVDLYLSDEYVREKRPGAFLCLPMVQQTRLAGVLYLERSLTASGFTSGEIAGLEILASQATISLQQARQYFDLQRSEAFLAQGQSLGHTGSFGWKVSSGNVYWSEETYKIFGYAREIETTTLEMVFERIHPDDRDQVQRRIDRAVKEKARLDFEHRLLLPDGSVKYVHVSAPASETPDGKLEYVGALTDVTAARQAEATLRESEAYLAEAQRLSHTGSWAWNPVTGENRYWSEECFHLLGFDPAEGMPRFEDVCATDSSGGSIDLRRRVDASDKATGRVRSGLPDCSSQWGHSIYSLDWASGGWGVGRTDGICWNGHRRDGAEAGGGRARAVAADAGGPRPREPVDDDGRADCVGRT